MEKVVKIKNMITARSVLLDICLKYFLEEMDLKYANQLLRSEIPCLNTDKTHNKSLD